MTKTIADTIAQSSIDLYNTLKPHGKPTRRPNGVEEWTILATVSIVVTGTLDVTPVSLGTGVKVLPANRLPPLGDAVHDCHAEVMARRGFVRWLLEEGRRGLKSEVMGDQGPLVIWNGKESKFQLRQGLEVWLYVSTLPCGDASMLHTAAHQDPEVASMKAATPPDSPETEPDVPTTPSVSHAVRGRNGYDNFGAIRTKPGRADSTPTISLSCSDKIANWTVLGLQGALLEDLFDPVYLKGIVVGGLEHEPPSGWKNRHGKTWREVIRREIERALWGRLGSLIGRLPPPFDLHPPAIQLTDVEFHHSKTRVAATTPLEPSPSSLSISLVPLLHRPGSQDVLYNGTRQACSWRPPGLELMKPKARAKVCKMDTMRAYLELLEAVYDTQGTIGLPPKKTTYYQLKHRPDSAYQKAKVLVRGTPAAADTLHSNFGPIGSFDVTRASPPGSTTSTVLPPFSGWIVSGKKWESFDRDAQIHDC